MPNYLDQTGVSTLWAKIKQYVSDYAANNNGHIYVFATEAACKSALNGANNTAYKVGDILLISASGAADRYVSAVNSSKSGDYGYYSVSEIEVTLTDYQKKQLTTAITVNGSSKTTVEAALSAINNLASSANSAAASNADEITKIKNGTTTVGKATNVDLSWDSANHAVKAGSGNAATVPLGTGSVAGLVKLGAEGGAQVYSEHTVIGQDLTNNKIVLGSGNSSVKTSSVGIATRTTGVTNDDASVPTSSAVAKYVTERVNSAVKTYVVNASQGTSGSVNSRLNSNDSDIEINYLSGTTTIDVVGGDATGTISFSDGTLKVGDVILVKQENLPDRWVSAIDTTAKKITLTKLETQDLRGFVLTSTINNKNYTGSPSQTATSITTGSDGALSVTYGSIQIAESQVTNLSTDLNGKASSTHVHGNITNDGKITATGVALENGDAIVIVDSNDSSKIKKTSITFDGSTTTKYLSQKGTWVDADFIPTNVVSNVGDMITVGTSGITKIAAPSSIVEGTTPVLSCVSLNGNKIEAWDAFTPISDNFINNLN